LTGTGVFVYNRGRGVRIGAAGVVQNAPPYIIPRQPPRCQAKKTGLTVAVG